MESGPEVTGEFVNGVLRGQGTFTFDKGIILGEWIFDKPWEACKCHLYIQYSPPQPQQKTPTTKLEVDASYRDYIPLEMRREKRDRLRSVPVLSGHLGVGSVCVNG